MFRTRKLCKVAERASSAALVRNLKRRIFIKLRGLPLSAIANQTEAVSRSLSLTLCSIITYRSLWVTMPASLQLQSQTSQVLRFDALTKATSITFLVFLLFTFAWIHGPLFS